MLFSSFEFIFFISILFVLYYFVPGKCRWMLLLLFNGIFMVQAGWTASLVMLVVIINTYLWSLAIEQIIKKQQKICLAIGLVIHFSIMLWFRICYDHMPLALAYYGLMTAGYLVEVYRRHPAEKNILKLSVCISFFPSLVQGPINQFSCIRKQIFSPKAFQGGQAVLALERILWGYFKKLVIADRIYPAVLTIIDAPDQYTGFYVFVGMIFYAIRLYADFTGGIDITMGIAQYLGVELVENFNVPFTSKNLAEYWRRWHISLGEWIKNYVFYPLSISKPVNRAAKKIKKINPELGKRFPVYVAAMVAWFVTGLWHGSEPHFIVWGMANCMIILISRECRPLYEKFHQSYPKLTASRAYEDFQAVRTFLLVCILRMFDCYRDVTLTADMFLRMFTEFSVYQVSPDGFLQLGITAADYVILGIGVFMMYLVGKRKKELPWTCHYAAIIFLLFAVLIFGNYGIGYDPAQFIYGELV